METLSSEELHFAAATFLDQGMHDLSIKYMNKAIELNPALDTDEQDVFIAPYRHKCKVLRYGLKQVIDLVDPEHEEECPIKTIEAMNEEIAQEIRNVCQTVETVVTEKLLPAALEPDTAKLHLFIADFRRYMSELEVESESTESAEISEDHYQQAIAISSELIHPACPIKLNSVLNYSILYNDLGRTAEAIEMLQSAHNECKPLISDLPEEEHVVSSNILQQMLDNSIAWSVE